MFMETVLKIHRVPACLVFAMLAGCANPVNRVTMDNYAEACGNAERSGRLEVAVEACHRAWVNTRTGSLGTELESAALYNLGRVQKKALKLPAAEESLKRSLELEEVLSGKESAKTGRRLAELAAVLIVQKRTAEGVPLVERLANIAPQYQGPEKKFAASLLLGYADELRKTGNLDKAMPLEASFQRLGFTRQEFLAN
jgi:tetratricopeptide (TPR) repeat protein